VNARSPTSAEAAAKRKRAWYITAIVMAAALTSFLSGYEGSIMSAALPYIIDRFPMTDAMRGFVQTSPVLGCMVGSFVGSWFCDKIGREKTLLICTVMIGICTLVTATAQDVAVGPLTLSALTIFTAFRILIGFAAGAGAIAAPMYIAEVAPPRMRGKLGMAYQLALVAGSAAAPLVAYPISLYMSPETSWRWMFASGLVLVALLFIFVSMLPPSPRWLSDQGRFQEALAVLNQIHGPELAEKELLEIKNSVQEEEGDWSELWQKGVRMAIGIGLLLAFFNNWTGWSAMGGYITILVEQAGVKTHSLAILQLAYTSISMTVMTIVSMALVDRLGRRPLWIFSSILMALVTFATGLVFQYHLTGMIVIVVLCLCTVPHGLALGGLPWLMMSELYPNRIRAKAVAITTTFLFLVIYTCGQFFPIFAGMSQKHIGSPAGVFWLFTFICILSTIFGCTIMPETKGRTLEDIARSMRED
jgi:SP family arabinose:H+ symporter-like MFS transporter